MNELIAIPLVGLATVAMAIGYWLFRRWQQSPADPGAREEDQPAQTTPVDVRIQPVIQVDGPALPPIPPPSDLEMYLPLFDGLFTSLWNDIHGQSDDSRWESLCEWEEVLEYTNAYNLQAIWRRMLVEAAGRETVVGGPPLSKAEAMKMARSWLALFRSWGLERDDATYLKLEPGIERSYALVNPNHAFSDRAQIIYPSWCYQGVVVEKGQARVVRSDTGGV